MNSAPLLCAIMLIKQNALPALLYFKIVGDSFIFSYLDVFNSLEDVLK